MKILFSIIVMLLIFTVLVVLHEFGHYIVAVKSGVRVEEFAIGMGPVLYRKQLKHTLLSIRAFPIGGFCAMKDENGLNEEEENEKTEGLGFCEIKPLKKIAVLAAGPIMNFLAAILIFFIIFCINGTDVTTRIDTFTQDSPAVEAGIVEGDRVVSINSMSIEKWEDISSAVASSKGNAIPVTVEKADGTQKTYTVTPYEEEEHYYLGILPKTKTNVFRAFTNSFVVAYKYIQAIFDVLVGVFRGEYGLEAFSGPIGATAIIHQAIPMGLAYVLNIAAAISMSLGLFNLFPIPALDGSRILVVLIEMIKGSPVNKTAENAINVAGFVLLMLFAVVIAYKDIVTFF